MRNAHRKTHLVVWLLLVPVLCFVLYAGLDARQTKQPAIDNINNTVDVERGGLLP